MIFFKFFTLTFNFIEYACNTVNVWWPWLFVFNLNWFIQLIIIYTYINLYVHNNIYYTLLYVFLNFFFLGVYLSTLQLDLFTAFLWLLECSVVFVFLLLLFFLNVKGAFKTHSSNMAILALLCCLVLYLTLINVYQEHDTLFCVNVFQNNLVDNFYESIFNFLLNDLYGLSISYYTINSPELIIVGFLLLLGSVVCVNLNQASKNASNQGHGNFVKVIKLFENLASFAFLRKQNLINQSNRKSCTKIYTKT